MSCPLPRYYLCHAVIALLIAACLWPLLGLNAGLAAGVAFYAGREYTQWESGLAFDWKGVVVPFVICSLIFITVELM